jgi:hypothetical protein
MTDISHITLTGRPLIISDVDDVILEFIAPFQLFLEHSGMKFIPRSFRLAGNILRSEDDFAISMEDVRILLHRFFEEQNRWQQPFEHALPALIELSREADIVLLTAMPPKFADIRRKHLLQLGLPFPLIATESPKGPVAASIRAASQAPVVFVDDMAHNLVSVAEHLPDCLLLNLAPPSEVHRMAPRPPESARPVADWLEASDYIRGHFNLSMRPLLHLES